MRTDVKLGVVVALVMVLAAGGYFMFRGEKQEAIPLSNTGAAADPKSQPAKPTTPAKTATNQPRNPAAANRPATNPRPAPNNPNSTAGRTSTPATHPVSRPPVVAATSPDAVASQPVTKPIVPNTTIPATNPATTGPTLTNSADPIPTPGTSQPGPITSPASDNTSVADRATPPTTGKEVSLTGIPNTSPAGSLNPNTPPTGMTPLTNRPTTGTPNNTIPVASNPPTSTIPPGINTPAKPAAEPAPKSIVPDVAMETHKVQTGDSLTSLAQTYYGDTKYAKILADANPKLADPNRLKVGSLVNIPPLPTNADALVAGSNSAKPEIKTDANGKRTYTVKSGDSFYSIAKSQLGNASRWKELLALNSTVVNGDPTSLQPGQRLVLPESR